MNSVAEYHKPEEPQLIAEFQRPDGPQPRTEYQRPQETDSFKDGPSTPKQQRFNTGSHSLDSLSLSRGPQTKSSYQKNSKSKPSPRTRKSPACPGSSSVQSVNTPQSTAVIDTRIDTNTSHEEQIISGALGVKDELTSNNIIRNTGIKESVVHSVRDPLSTDLLSSIDLNYTQTSVSDNIKKEVEEIIQSEARQSTNDDSRIYVKIEPTTEEDSELEVTGIELSGAATGVSEDWGQNNINELSFQSTVNENDPLEQRRAQIGEGFFSISSHGVKLHSWKAIQGSYKLWKSWKTWKITPKSFMHGKIMEFEKN